MGHCGRVLLHMPPRRQSPASKGTSSQREQFEALRENPAAMLELLQRITSGEMGLEETLALNELLEEDNHTSPFPARKAKKCITRILGSRTLDDISPTDIDDLTAWCREDHYMQCVFQAGAIPALNHTLRLCAQFAEERVTKKTTNQAIPSNLVKMRELTLYAIADGLLNYDNKQTAELHETTELLVTVVHQEGHIKQGFPVGITAMNFAIKALGEVVKSFQVQDDRPGVQRIGGDKNLLRVILTYVRDDEVVTPVGFRVSSVLCWSRFITCMATIADALTDNMVELGYLSTLKRLRVQNPQSKEVLASCIGLLEKRTDSTLFGDSSMHTRTQARRHCDQCSAEEDPAAPLRVCASCKQCRYCSRECQVKHWRAGHSKECATLAKQNPPKKKK